MDRFQKLTVGQKRHLAIVCTVIFSVLLTISVLISLRRETLPSSALEEIPGSPERINISLPIPLEGIFLPDEPDFLPEVLLERVQRTSWTTDDAAEHWQDPLGSGEEQWREKVEAAIDEFLERVP